MTYRPNKSIWRFVQDAEPGIRDDGDTWFMPSTGQSWVWDEANTIWSPFQLTQTAGVGTAGYKMSGAYTVRIDRVNFSNDTIASLAATANVASSGGGFSDFVNGYKSGGATGSTTTTSLLERLRFSTESVSTVSNTARVDRLPIGLESLIAGYTSGGYRNDPTTLLSYVDKMDFVSETQSALTSSSYTGFGRSALRNRANGYIQGASTGGGTIAKSNRDRLVFSTEVVASMATTLLAARRGSSGLDAPTAGYTSAGVDDPSSITSIEKLAFSTETNSYIVSTVVQGRWDTKGVSSRLAGYVLAGSGATVEKLSFSDESNVLMTSTLGGTQTVGAAFENLN